MENVRTQTILEIIAMAIVADKKVLPEETQTFIKVVQSPSMKKFLGEELSGARLLLWHEMNIEKLLNIITDHQFKNWFDESLNLLGKSETFQPILDSIKLIAECDNEFHISENAYTTLIYNRLTA